MRSIGHVPPGSILLLEDVDSITKMRKAAQEVGRHGGGPGEATVSSAPTPAYASGGASGEDMASFFAPTLSELLNALDGLASVEKILVVMTTNHPELLDHAMVRPGRVDYRLHLAECEEEQAGRLFEKFYQPSSATLRRFLAAVPDGVLTPAQLQDIFLRSTTPEEAIEAVDAVAIGRACELVAV